MRTRSRRTGKRVGRGPSFGSTGTGEGAQMTTTRSHHSPRPGERRLDVASLALLVCGLCFGVVAYMLITKEGANPLLLVPSVVAVVLGGTHLVKHQAPPR
ncbi:hypothetical protein BN12_220024 [Nostocoides japonicum T1-X7]|uniref:Uncharacterized protein n=1 Tax=Nostocoides japonicum T1-X7 TaxID=1194083 RepID=A0A077LVN9_9MICO|nr:hypothetical protein BN12_220024 [Tetrasphaera japonica T1-X7]